MNAKQNDNLIEKSSLKSDELVNQEKLNEIVDNDELDNDTIDSDNAMDEDTLDFDQNLEGKALDKEIKKFNMNYKRSLKQSMQSIATLKTIDEEYLKKIRLKRNEIIAIKKKIDASNNELDKAFAAFKEIYYHQVDEDIITDTKDKALAQKTLSFRKTVRDIDGKLEKLDKEYKEKVLHKEEELTQYKKTFTATLVDLERKKKGETQKGKKAKQEEIASLNEMLSETNDRIRINAINERLNTIKKESSEGTKEINIKYLGLRKEEDIKNVNHLNELQKEKVTNEQLYQTEKATLTFDKKKEELEYAIASKTYILAAKRADNNLKKDLVIKKDGMLINNIDNNKVLYGRCYASIMELLDLQRNYNKLVLDATIKDLSERTSLLLKKIKYVSSEFEKENTQFLEKASPTFIQSLVIFNSLSLKNLRRVIEKEVSDLNAFVYSAYLSASRCETGYQEINQKMNTLFQNYKKECQDLMLQLFTLTSKQGKEILNITKLDSYLVSLTKERNETYKKYLDELNHVVISLVTGENETTAYFKDEEKVKEEIKKDMQKYFVGDYQSTTEELEAIDVIYKENEEQIEKELTKLNNSIDQDRVSLEQEREATLSKILSEEQKSLEELDTKLKQELETIENNYNEQIKNITGVYKTENKLL